MKLANLTTTEIRDLDRDALILIPTGSMEQHGSHLPLCTDTFLVSKVAETLEAAHASNVLMVPALWLGASLHHMSFSGTLSASFETYESALTDVIESLRRHGFWKFFVLNGHGGNASSNDIALRKLKNQHPELVLCAANYYDFADQAVLTNQLKGPLKTCRHACEVETSLMLHLAPSIVRLDLAVDDGLQPSEPIRGLVMSFDEITEQGAFGFPSLATAEKGKLIFESLIANLNQQIKALCGTVALAGIPGTEE